MISRLLKLHNLHCVVLITSGLTGKAQKGAFWGKAEVLYLDKYLPTYHVPVCSKYLRYISRPKKSERRKRRRRKRWKKIRRRNACSHGTYIPAGIRGEEETLTAEKV